MSSVNEINLSLAHFVCIECAGVTKNRGSAVPLHVKSYPLKLDALLSCSRGQPAKPKGD